MFLATYICKVQRPPVRCHYILGPFKEKTSSAPSETGANHFISVAASFTIAVLVGCLFLRVVILQAFTVAGICLLLQYDVFTIAVRGRFASRRKTALCRRVKYYS